MNEQYISRALKQLDYPLYRRISRMVTPMLEDEKHLSEIYAFIHECEDFKHYDQYMMNCLVVAAVYEMYCPGSFFVNSVMKLKVGLRDSLCAVMGFNSPEMVNYFHQRSVPFMKFRTKAFGQNVDKVIEQFKCYSLISEDWELFGT